MFKAVLQVCVLAIFAQSIAGQYIGGRFAAAPLAYARAAGPYPLGAYGPAALAASNGAGLVVTSASLNAPIGVSVQSDNVIEGPLAVSGALPFLGTVALEGVLPTAGAGSVNYGCGNGAVAILAEEEAPIALAGPIGYGLGPYRAGYRI